MKNNKSYYSGRKLKTIDELSKVLGVSSKTLTKIAVSSNRYYCKNAPKLKECGGVRQTYSVKEPLKTILKKIKERLFTKVVLSEFLSGGIKGKDIKSNAIWLCNFGKPKALLNFDIKEYFPSIRESQIKDIWLNFFKFSQPVANLLTKLVTVSDQLPQGACTSNCLANLIFWEHEYKLAKGLAKKEMIYARFVDDINITINSNYHKEDLNFLIKTIISFVKKHGFTINRKKLKICPQTGPMITNKSVMLNNGCLTASSLKRKTIKKNLSAYLHEYKCNPKDTDLELKYKQVQGRLKFLQYIHPHNSLKKMNNILCDHKTHWRHDPSRFLEVVLSNN